MRTTPTTRGSSAATSAQPLARQARLRPLASHARVMHEAASSCTSHWPSLVEAEALANGEWPWGGRADNAEGDLLAACEAGSQAEREAWLERDAARRHRRAAQLRAEAAALRADREGWSDERRDAYNASVARMDAALSGQHQPTQSRFDAAANPALQPLVAGVVEGLKGVRRSMAMIAATASPDQQVYAIQTATKAEAMLKQLGIEVAALLRSSVTA